MYKCKEITFCAKELLKTHRIQVSEANKKEVVDLLSEYIDLLIFNIVAVVSIICTNIGVKKVILQHINYLSKYIDKRCLRKKPTAAAKMSGGAFNTAAFFGVSEPRYTVENEGRDLLTIDFMSGTARNAIPMMGGGSGGSGGSGSGKAHAHLKTPSCIKLDKIIVRKIKNVFKFFGLGVNTEAVSHLKARYDMIVEELFESITKIKGAITPAKVSQLIHKSKIMKKN